jgi:hypothetical protein
MRSGVLASGVLLLSMTGCHGETEQRDSTDPAPAAADRLQAAVSDLTSANTGHYEQRLVTMGDDLWRETGSYQLDPPAYAATRVHQEGSHTLYVASVTIGADSWAGIADSPGTEPTCWLKAAPDVLASAFATGQLAAGLALPSAVAIPAEATNGAARDDDTLRGEADLAAAAGIFGDVFPELVALDPDEHARLPIDFDLDGESFAGWSLTLEGLARAADAAGHPVDANLTRADATYVATLSGLGDPVRIDPPSETVVDVGAGSMQDFEDAMADCLGPGAGTRP